MRNSRSLPLAAGAGLIVLLIAAVPAEARIRCNGPYQVVQGSQIATPYCQDSYLAVIAREYGMRVSPEAVRQSPSVKAQVCRLVGRDNRAQTACAGTNDPFRGRRL